MRKISLALLLFFCFTLVAQEEYPKDAFRPPMDIPIILAGTFGELRSNHFHSGIDIKTQQREGIPVMLEDEARAISQDEFEYWHAKK